MCRIFADIECNGQKTTLRILQMAMGRLSFRIPAPISRPGETVTDFSRDGDGPGTCSGGRSHPNHGSRHGTTVPCVDQCHPELPLPGCLFGSNAVAPRRLSSPLRMSLIDVLMFYIYFIQIDPIRPLRALAHRRGLGCAGRDRIWHPQYMLGVSPRSSQLNPRRCLCSHSFHHPRHLRWLHRPPPAHSRPRFPTHQARHGRCRARPDL